MTTDSNDSKVPTRLYLVTNKSTGEKILVDTYHPSKAATIATAHQFVVSKPGPMDVVKLVQAGTVVLTAKEY